MTTTWPHRDSWVTGEYSLNAIPEGCKAKQNQTLVLADQQSWEVEPSRAAGQEWYSRWHWEKPYPKASVYRTQLQRRMAP